MARTVLTLSVLAVLAFAAGRWSSAEGEAGDTEARFVRAQHYRIVWADSALDLSHGGGRWVHELFFPDFGVAATVVTETEYRTDGEAGFVSKPRLHVGRAEAPRLDLTGLHDSESAPRQQASDVLVPADLAKAVAAFAELTDQYRATGTRLGAELTSAMALRPLVGGAEAGAPTSPTPPAPDED